MWWKVHIELKNTDFDVILYPNTYLVSLYLMNACWPSNIKINCLKKKMMNFCLDNAKCFFIDFLLAHQYSRQCQRCLNTSQTQRIIPFSLLFIWFERYQSQSLTAVNKTFHSRQLFVIRSVTHGHINGKIITNTSFSYHHLILLWFCCDFLQETNWKDAFNIYLYIHFPIITAAYVQ